MTGPDPAILADIENFQPIAKTRLHLDGLTVIVGPSDRGKSALLRAIEGALFNKSGDVFVRKGAPQSTVTLVFGSECEIRWEKGKGVNRFTVDGEVYDKVGKDAPTPVQKLGFKDVLIGARLKDEKAEGGEWIRPQVSRQVPPEHFFLLDRSGNFLYEVLAKLSRLAVLQKAARLCMADLVATRQERQVVVDQQQAAAAQVTALAPVDPLRERVKELENRLGIFQTWTERRAQLSALVQERKARQQQASVSLPAPRTKPLPDYASIQQLRRLVPQRRSLARVHALPMPPTRPGFSRKVIEAASLWGRLRPLVEQRKALVEQVKQLDRVEYKRTLDHTDAVAQLERFKLEVGVCPTCGKAF